MNLLKNESDVLSFLTPYTISFPLLNSSIIFSITLISSCKSASIEIVASTFLYDDINPAYNAF